MTYKQGQTLRQDQEPQLECIHVDNDINVDIDMFSCRVRPPSPCLQNE